MKESPPTLRSTFLIALFGLLPATGVVHAQSAWELWAHTGQQSNTEEGPQGGYLYPDNTLFRIDLSTGAATELFRTTWGPDSHAIGFNPVDGMLYHTFGSQAYRDDPARSGHEQGGEEIPGLAFQDNYYMEKINLATRVPTAVFNNNPPPNPDPALPGFGLPADRPTWALPEERRTAEQTDPSFRVNGENEYVALRGMAWSTAKNLFYVSDEEGIFTLTAAGGCTFLARPAFPTDGGDDVCKGIAFVRVGNATKLLVGHRDAGLIMEVDPETGEVVSELALTYPPGGGDPVDEFGGVLGLAQHPVTGVLYGIRHTSEPFTREIVTIDPTTGDTTLVGSPGLHLSTIAFVPAGVPSPPLKVQNVTLAGTDITISWSGGAPPYQLQTSTTLATAGWSNLGAPTPTTTATVPMNGPSRFYRVQGQ